MASDTFEGPSTYDDVLAVIDEHDDGDGVSLEMIFDELTDAGIERDRIRNAVGFLRKRGEIYEPRDGFFRVTIP